MPSWPVLGSLIATTRLSSVSHAFQTDPNAPVPICSKSSKWAIRRRGHTRSLGSVFDRHAGVTQAKLLSAARADHLRRDFVVRYVQQPPALGIRTKHPKRLRPLPRLAPPSLRPAGGARPAVNRRRPLVLRHERLLHRRNHLRAAEQLRKIRHIILNFLRLPRFTPAFVIRLDQIEHHLAKSRIIGGNRDEFGEDRFRFELSPSFNQPVGRLGEAFPVGVVEGGGGKGFRRSWCFNALRNGATTEDTEVTEGGRWKPSPARFAGHSIHPNLMQFVTPVEGGHAYG